MSPSAEETRSALLKWRARCVRLAAAGGLLCAAGAARGGGGFFRAYLCAYMFWFGLGLGCLGLLLLHRLVGGAWGALIRPQLEAGAATAPWLGLLFLPLAFGLPALYPWARPEAVAADALLRHQAPYLNVPFFLLRAAAAFACWTALARGRRPAPALILYFATLSLCAVDWTMSLDPHWTSTVYGLLVIVGQALSALAMTIVGLGLLGGGRRLSDASPPKPFLDLGNLLLALVMLWAYASFSQYLIIWSGNIPGEISWYLARGGRQWAALAPAIAAALFFLPFPVLLVRRNKSRLDRLAAIAGLIVAGRALESFWLVRPSFGALPCAAWLVAAATAAVGGAWLAVYLGELARLPLAIGRPLPEEAA